MTKPNYLEHINRVAVEFTLKRYEERLLNAWSKFETAAQQLPKEYDILDQNIPDGFFIMMTDFITLLYENGDGSPVVDCDQIKEKDAAYGGSWHARGGTGAFHALARKGDRIVSMLAQHRTLEQCRTQKQLSESIDDTIGDLRRYLILACAWHWAREDEYERAATHEPPKLSEEGQLTYEALKEEYMPLVSHALCACGHPAVEHDEEGCNHYDGDQGMCPCAQLVTKEQS